MSEPDARIAEFLTNLGKALSRINLYSLNHPLVAEAVKSSYAPLAGFLSEKDELSLAWAENKLLVNGATGQAPPAILQALAAFFKRYQLHSVTFQKDVAEAELTSFYKIFAGKQDELKGAEAVRDFLEKEGVKNIHVNVALFSRVEKGRAPAGMPGGGGGGGFGAGSAASEKARGIIENLEGASLDGMIWEVISKAVDDADDRKKIYEIIFKQIQGELGAQVEKATHQIRQEKEQVTNEKERTEAVINNLAEGIVVVDDGGRIVMMNPTAERIYGASFSDLKGKVLTEAVKNREDLMVALSRDIVSATPKEISQGVAVQSSELTQSVIKSSTSTIKTPDGKIIGILSILNDIAKLKELQRMQNDFVANVTHELRSPLTAIKAAIGTLSEGNASMSAQHKNILTIANRNIDRLARLINDILDFAKVSEGRVRLNLKPLDTKAVMDETVQSVQSWADNKQIKLSVRMEADIPKVMADPDRLTQILINLLSNAIKFTPKGGGIALTAEKSVLYVKFIVQDSGPGIPQKDQERIFQKFFQLKQTEKSDTPGTGLGLFITKTLVELHGGQIGFDSQEGRGTAFQFTVPVAQVAGPAPAPSKAAPPPAQKSGWFARWFRK